MSSQSSQAKQERVTALQTATEQWSSKATADYQSRIARAKAILSGRTGSDRLAQSTVQAVQSLVVDSVEDFLAD